MTISTELNKIDAAFEDAARNPAKAVRQTGEKIAALTETVIDDTRGGVRRFSRFVGDEGKHAVRAFRTGVKDRPSLAVGLAISAGLAVGMLIPNRR